MSIIIEGHLTPSRLQRLAMASMLALALAIPAMAADTDNDGLEDSIETEYGLTVGVTTCAVYLDAVNGDDTNSGLAPSDAKRTFAGVLAVQRNASAENVILVAPGVYSGTQNRNLDFMGDDIIIRSTMGAQDTIVDLGDEGRFLYLHNGETVASRIDGLTIRNGYAASHGTAVCLEDASLDIRNCIFENNRSGRLVRYEYSEGCFEEHWQDAMSTAAVYAEGGTVLAADCVFYGNVSESTDSCFYNDDYMNAGAVKLVESQGNEFRRCVFIGNRGANAGAVLLAGAEAYMDSCRFKRCVAQNGGAATAMRLNIYDQETQTRRDIPSRLEMSGCLFLYCRSKGAASDVQAGTGTTLVAVCCTFAFGNSSGGNSLATGGEASIGGCAATGGIQASQGGELAVTNSCCPEPLGAYGTGNIQAPPGLTPAGLLLASSPCIDTGLSSGFPQRDILGVARPSGTASDIGCHEFLDTDGDGMPDILEPGGDAAPTDDSDGDGIPNLLEYLAGTEMSSTDTDGDGIADGEELLMGFDPLLHTRIVHADSIHGDDTLDGLTSENAVRTLARAIDLLQDPSCDNVVLVHPGIYSGEGNRELDFQGTDIALIAVSGTSDTIIDLGGAGAFLRLDSGETASSRISGLHVRNGYTTSGGTAIDLENASMSILNCVFEDNRSGHEVSYGPGNSTYMAGGESTAAVRCKKGTVMISGSSFVGNISRQGMGGANAGALLLDDSFGNVIEDSIFLGNVGVGAGAVLLCNADAEFHSTRFIHNLCTGSGGVLSAEGGWSTQGSGGTVVPGAMFINCLLLDNRATNSCSDLAIGGNCRLVLKNSTIAGGSSKDGVSARLDGNAELRNSIVTGVVSLPGQSDRFSANYCCTIGDWSRHGIGNIMADPMLTGAGLLSAGSPCIDAGITDATPTPDILGNARPAGNGVDIGCHEFLDTDGDGIPDCLEGTNGILPDEDEDGDGIPNLQEYLLGTDIFRADTDGDGMNDGEEISHGRNPNAAARMIHVSPDGNDSADGLSPERPLKTLAAAVKASRTAQYENIVLVAPGVYSGEGNHGLDFGGFDIALDATGARGTVVVNLPGEHSFLSLKSGETYASRLSGIEFAESWGGASAISLNRACLTLRRCRFRDFGPQPEDSDLHSSYGFSEGCVLYAESSGCRMEGTEIVECAYQASNCSLIKLSSSDLKMESCRVSRCDSGGGAVFVAWNSGIHMTNTAVYGNNLASTGQVAHIDGTSLLDAVNCTFSRNTSGSNATIVGYGEVHMLNTVFRERIDGCSVSMSHCIVSNERANAETGCIATDPGLAGGLFLTPGSPCIDAGSSNGAPPMDYAGTPRPQGIGVDIGCEEYRDSNGDGISDFYEAWCGFQLTAEGDEDGDGLSNLQEMILGTDAGRMDTDGDGMPDGWEVAGGLDPLVDDAALDSDGDGLSNIREYAAGTAPNSPDTDGDGRSDGWEVDVAFSNPLAADFDGGISATVEMEGSLFTDSDGGWDTDNGSAVARGRSGWLEYSVPITEDGIYVLSMEIAEAASNDDGTPWHWNNAQPRSFSLDVAVDGASCGAPIKITLADGAGRGECMMPFLRTGAHTVRISWSDAAGRSSLRVESITLVCLSGQDSDADGVADWMETRLAGMARAVLPESSLVSPVCIGGDKAFCVEGMAVSGYYVEPDGEDPLPKIRRVAGNRWYVDLPLNPGGTPCHVEVSWQDSAVSVAGDILWETADTASMETIDIRKDDEMRLGASLPEGVESWTLSVNGQEYAMERDGVLRYKFEETGDVRLVATWLNVDGTPGSHASFVRVKSASFGGEVACRVGYGRDWRLPCIGEDIYLEVDNSIHWADSGWYGGARYLWLKCPAVGDAYATARLYEDGPVLDTTRVRATGLTSHSDEGKHRITTDFGDGIVLYDGYITVDAVVQGVTVHVSLWGTNSFFADGTQEKTFTWEDFDSSGELRFSMIGMERFNTCMGVTMSQDGTTLWSQR